MAEINIILYEKDLIAVDEGKFLQKGKYVIMLRTVFDKLPDDTYVKMDKELLTEFRQFIKKRKN